MQEHLQVMQTLNLSLIYPLILGIFVCFFFMHVVIYSPEGKHKKPSKAVLLISYRSGSFHSENI